MFKIEIETGMPISRGVVQAVRQAIESGELPVAAQLPPQSDIAKSLGVSVTAVGHAYRQLEKQGLVTARRGSGTYVTPEAVSLLHLGRQHSFDRIFVVIGADQLTDCSRELVYAISDILTGVKQVVGERVRFVFVRNFTSADISVVGDNDAVLIASYQEVDSLLLAELTRRAIPVIGVRSTFGSLKLPAVFYDIQQAASLATQHLIDCGYRRIGFVGLKWRSTVPMGPKFFAFASTLHDLGLDYRAAHVCNIADQNAQGMAYRAALDMACSGDLPEAIFADTDYKAMEVINALQSVGLNVPGDVGVIGYDDLPEAATFDPPLTTIRVPRRERGRCVGQMLLNWPRDGGVPAELKLEASLIIRRTTINIDATKRSNAPPILRQSQTPPTQH